MSRLYRFPLVPDVEVRVCSFVVRSIPQDIQERVDDIWERGKRATWLFDGVCLSLTSISASLLKGELVPYRAWYACTRDHSLFEKMPIFPLALSGRTIAEDRVLVGRRSPKVSTYAGRYECVPSGTFSQDAMDSAGVVNVAQMVRTELEEEAGLSQFISFIQPLALYWSPEDNTWDMHVDIRVRQVPQTLVSPTGEYDRLFFADPLAEPEGDWVPLSKELLRVRL